MFPKVTPCKVLAIKKEKKGVPIEKKKSEGAMENSYTMMSARAFAIVSAGRVDV